MRIKLHPVILACALSANVALADSYASFGVGTSNSTGSRLFGIGYKSEIGFDISDQLELGLWSDSNTGRSTSGYFTYQLGIEVNNPTVIGKVMFGPAVITAPDSLLGGSFPQFAADVFFGIKDNKGKTLGANYKHFSSAGIYLPNLGRDFIGLEVGIPW